MITYRWRFKKEMDDEPLNPPKADQPQNPPPLGEGQNLPPTPPPVPTPEPQPEPKIPEPPPAPPIPSAPPPEAELPTEPAPLPDWATVKTSPTSPVESPWTEPPVSPQAPPIPPPPPPEPQITEQPLGEIPPPPQPPPPAAAEGRRPPILGMLLKVFLGLIVIALIVFLGTRVFSFLQEKRAPQTVTLTYWGLWEDKNILSSVISDFEREHPNIKVEYQKRDIKQYRETLKARLATGGGPDIFRFHNSWLPMFKDDLLPLPKVLGENPQNDFYPVVSRDLKIGDAFFGLPLEIDTLLLFANKDLFKETGLSPPKTWEEMRETARKLTVKDATEKIKTAGVALGTYDNINHASDIISLMFAQNGVDLKNIKSTSQNASDALLFYTSFAKGKAKVWDETLDPSILAFAKGNLAMFFGFSWDIFTIRAIKADLDFEILPVPQIPGDKKITLASYWAEGVSKKSKNQKAAFEFLAFLNKKEVLQKFYSEASKTRLFGEPYARVDLAEKLTANPYLSPVVSQAKDATSTPFSSDTFDNGLNSELNRYLGDAVRSVLGNTSPETAIETLIKGVETVFAKYGIR